jgi:hypothetical protein
MSKICSCCNVTKSITEFGKRAQCTDGVNAQCKACVTAYVKQYRSLHLEYVEKDRHASAQRYYRRNNPIPQLPEVIIPKPTSRPLYGNIVSVS